MVTGSYLAPQSFQPYQEGLEHRHQDQEEMPALIRELQSLQEFLSFRKDPFLSLRYKRVIGSTCSSVGTWPGPRGLLWCLPPSEVLVINAGAGLGLASHRSVVFCGGSEVQSWGTDV